MKSTTIIFSLLAGLFFSTTTFAWPQGLIYLPLKHFKIALKHDYNTDLLFNRREIEGAKASLKDCNLRRVITERLQELDGKEPTKYSAIPPMRDVEYVIVRVIKLDPKTQGGNVIRMQIPPATIHQLAK